MSVPQTSVGLLSKVGRVRPRESIIFMEHTLETPTGKVPSSVTLIKPIVDTANIKNDSLYPLSESYSALTGVIRTEWEIKESVNSDTSLKYVLKGSYEVDGSEVPFLTELELSAPEELPSVVATTARIENHHFIYTATIRRKNGKIPQSAYFAPEATTSVGLETGILLSQTYDQHSGELVGKYLVSEETRSTDIDFSTGFSILKDVPLVETTFKGTLKNTKTLKYKVLSNTLKGKTMTVALEVRWAVDNTFPASFSVITPFFTGSGVPTGIVNAKSVSYNPVNGIYQFDIKVNTIPEGLLNYTFASKAIAEDYPETKFSIDIQYNHQSSYTAKLLDVTLSNGLLSAEWKINKAGEPNYQLEHFSVPDADLAIGALEGNKPKVEWDVKNGKVITKWVVSTDNTQTLNYNFRGHFLADNKYIPWVIEFKAPAIGLLNEKIERIDSDTLGFNLFLISDGTVTETDATRLVVLVNRVPTTTHVKQDTSTETTVVSGTFNVPSQTDDAVEIELLGSIIVNDGVNRHIPVHIKSMDFITTPEVGTDLSLEVLSHTVIGNVEKIIQKVQFKDGTIPANVQLAGNLVSVNGVEQQAAKVSYRDGELSICVQVKPTGNKETFKLSGELVLPGYFEAEGTQFIDEVTVGSNDFPTSVTEPTIHVNKNIATIGFVVTLKNGGYPTAVKLTKLSKLLNITADPLIRSSFVYTPESGAVQFSTTCKEIVDTPLAFGLTGHFIITNGEESSEQDIVARHIQKPDVVASAEFIGYEYRNNIMTFKHKLISNRELPEKISEIGTPILIGCSGYGNLRYDKKSGLFSYEVWMEYKGGVRKVGVDLTLKLDDTNTKVKVKTGSQSYVPAATATYASHVFNPDGTIGYTWMFRDAVNGIPKNIRIDDYWKNNINTACRAIELEYDNTTGLGTVVVSVTKNKEGRFYAEASFKFPSPDVNTYPLTIDLED